MSEAPISPRQRRPLRNTSNVARPDRRRELTGGVGRGECHLQRRPVAFEVELERLAAADETAHGATQPVLVGLEAVTNAGLHDALAVLELRHQHE